MVKYRGEWEVGKITSEKTEVLSELDITFNHTVQSLTGFKSKLQGKDEEADKKLKNYLEWLSLKTELVSNEDSFAIPEEKKPYIRRSYVHWFHFGFNVGKEFGGHHPAVILKETGDSLFVLPLSSGKIPDNKKGKNYCVDIPFVFDLAPMARWANVLRIVCVSKMRIDLTSKHGRMQGKIMDSINESMRKSGIKI